MNAAVERLARSGNRAHRVSSPGRVGVYACSALITWGVVPFGAVHDWALWPMMIATLAVGVGCFGSASIARRNGVVLAGAFFIGAVLVQLLPVPVGILRAPATHISQFLANYDIAFEAGRPWHSLTISRELTARAVLILAPLVAFVSGLRSYLTGRSQLSHRIAAIIAALGLPVALFALIQKATFNGKIYWFWESQSRASNNYYGPFVNRNHFAGWMLLAAAVTAGFLIGQIQTSGRRISAGWRNRVLWLSTEEAARVLLISAALLVMLVSIMWSMSRSGMASTALVFLVLGVAAFRRTATAPRRAIATGSIVLLVLMSATWRGTDTIAIWYGRTETFEWRMQLWKDTLPALKDFWLFGSGLNTYGVLTLVYPQTDQTVHAAQAHSDYVQLAVEGGLLVGIPALILLALFIREVRRRLRQPQDEMTWWIRMGAVAGICGMALQETVEFSLQIPGVALLFAVLVAIGIHEPGTRQRHVAAEAITAGRRFPN